MKMQVFMMLYLFGDRIFDTHDHFHYIFNGSFRDIGGGLLTDR